MPRGVRLEDRALNELEEWTKYDRRIASKIFALLQEIRRTPFEGTGKPEALKGNLTGHWSRRITEEHRLVYRLSEVKGDAESEIVIVSCKGHYTD